MHRGSYGNECRISSSHCNNVLIAPTRITIGSPNRKKRTQSTRIKLRKSASLRVGLSCWIYQVQVLWNLLENPNPIDCSMENLWMADIWMKIRIRSIENLFIHQSMYKKSFIITSLVYHFFDHQKHFYIDQRRDYKCLMLTMKIVT